MVSAMVPDHFIMSMLLLLMTLYISGICAKDVCTLMELLPSLRKAHGIGAACGRSQYAGAGERRRNEQSM